MIENPRKAPEINELNSKTIGKKWKISETKSWIFEKITKINKPLAKLIQKKKRMFKKKKKEWEVKMEKLQPIPQKYKGS